jgi:hypothetical protein
LVDLREELADLATIQPHHDQVDACEARFAGGATPAIRLMKGEQGLVWNFEFGARSGEDNVAVRSEPEAE